MNKLNARSVTLIGLVLVVFLALAGLNVFIVNKNASQTLNITTTDNPTNSKITIVKIEENQDRKIKVITELNSAQKLKKGTYRIEFSGTGYQTQSTKIVLDAKPESITIYPAYSKEKLRSLLTNELSSIIATINTAFPITQSTYEIEIGNLYKLGQWYATTIHIKQTEEEERENYIDRYKIILSKESGTWKIITNPPEIIISKKKYPKVPSDILLEVNKNPSPN
jgi:5-hydroxyisourate hydrolase-like protein (transthyretin family)